MHVCNLSTVCTADPAVTEAADPASSSSVEDLASREGRVIEKDTPHLPLASPRHLYPYPHTYSTHTHMDTYSFSHIRAHSLTHRRSAHTHSHTRNLLIHTYIHIHSLTHTLTHTRHTLTHSHTHNSLIHTHTHIYIHSLIHTHTFTHTHIHMHTLLSSLSLGFFIYKVGYLPHGLALRRDTMHGETSAYAAHE